MELSRLLRSAGRRLAPRFFAAAALVAGLTAAPAAAQVVTGPLVTPPAGRTLSITEDEAIQIALSNNYALRASVLDVRTAEAQIREAWGQVLPRADLSSSYTRNLKSANPFAGSSAGGFFSGLAALDWLAYNESARTDDDPSTNPITLFDFRERQREGYDQAGIALDDSSNPFAVANQFQNGVSISQPLYNGTAFAAIRGARELKQINEATALRQAQQVVHQVRAAYYGALLAQERAAVSANSVARVRNTVAEAAKRVSQGVAPRYQQLSAEVEAANLETQLIQTQNLAADAVDNLKLLLGLPVEQPIRLSGSLEIEDRSWLTQISARDAMSTALHRRPDLEQARLAVRLREVQRSITRAQYFPTVSAFANLNYVGSVPDDRTRVLSLGDDPFTFGQENVPFFSESYWNPSVNAGLRLSWNLFNGFQTGAQMQQHQIAIQRAELQVAQLEEAVKLEVDRTLRNLTAAQQRIQAQEQNVQRAELNYQYASARLREGVSSQLEERQASEQLDLSRVNFLQAVYDYLVARSELATALGMPLGPDAANPIKLTSR